MILLRMSSILLAYRKKRLGMSGSSNKTVKGRGPESPTVWNDYPPCSKATSAEHILINKLLSNTECYVDKNGDFSSKRSTCSFKPFSHLDQ